MNCCTELDEVSHEHIARQSQEPYWIPWLKDQIFRYFTIAI